jgi:hypothetical protein
MSQNQSVITSHPDVVGRRGNPFALKIHPPGPLPLSKEGGRKGEGPAPLSLRTPIFGGIGISISRCHPERSEGSRSGRDSRNPELLLLFWGIDVPRS